MNCLYDVAKQVPTPEVVCGLCIRIKEHFQMVHTEKLINDLQEIWNLMKIYLNLQSQGDCLAVNIVVSFLSL